MGTITTCMTDSYRNELPQAIHNHVITTGHVFKAALLLAAASLGRSYGKGTVNYSTITAATTDEVANGSGYTTGGYASWTAGHNVTPTITSNVSGWGFSANPQWTSATFITGGCGIYNSSASNKLCSLNQFSPDASVTAGTLTLVMPTPYFTLT